MNKDFGCLCLNSCQFWLVIDELPIPDGKDKLPEKKLNSFIYPFSSYVMYIWMTHQSIFLTAELYVLKNCAAQLK